MLLDSKIRRWGAPSIHFEESLKKTSLVSASTEKGGGERGNGVVCGECKGGTRGRRAATETPSKWGFKEESQVSPTVSCGAVQVRTGAAIRSRTRNNLKEHRLREMRLHHGSLGAPTCTPLAGEQSEEAAALERAISGATAPQALRMVSPHHCPAGSQDASPKKLPATQLL